MSWPLVNLGSIASVKGGKRLPANSEYSTVVTDHPYLRVCDFGEYGIDCSNLKYIDFETHKKISRYTISDEDVYISIAGTIGVVGVIPSSLSGANLTENAAKIVVNDKKTIDKNYLVKFLSGPGKVQIENLTKSTSQPKLALFRIEEIEIPLPPLEEQKRIAAILDKAEAIRRKRQQAIILADDFLRSVFLEMFGDPVINPKGWEVNKLDDLCVKITDGEHGTVGRTESGRPYLMARNIDKNGSLDLTEISYISEKDHRRIYKRCGAETGDILLVCVGATIGKALIVPEMEEFSLARSVALLKPKNNTSSQYLLYLIKTAGIQQKFIASGNSSAQAGLYLGKIKALEVPFPPLKLQAEFSLIENKVKSILAKYKSGEAVPLFDSLSQKAFSGQL